MVRTRFYEYVELIIPGVSGGNTQTTFSFEDQPQIRNVPIYSIVAYASDSVNLSPLTGTNVIDEGQMMQTFLTLYTTDPTTQEQKNGIDRIPLIELNYIRTGGTPNVIYMPEMVGQTITWPKSFITLPVAYGNETNLCVLLGIRYGYSKKVQQ